MSEIRDDIPGPWKRKSPESDASSEFSSIKKPRLNGDSTSSDEAPDENMPRAMPRSSYLLIAPEEGHNIPRTLIEQEANQVNPILLLADIFEAYVFLDCPRFVDRSTMFWVFDVHNTHYNMRFLKLHETSGPTPAFFIHGWTDFVKDHKLGADDQILFNKNLDTTIFDDFYYILKYVKKPDSSKKLGDGAESSKKLGDGAESCIKEGGGAESSTKLSDDGAESSRKLDDGAESSKKPSDGSESNKNPGDGTESSRKPGESIESSTKLSDDGAESSRKPDDGAESSKKPSDGAESNKKPGDGTESSRKPGESIESSTKLSDDGAESSRKSDDGAESSKKPSDGAESNKKPGDCIESSTKLSDEVLRAVENRGTVMRAVQN